MAQSAPAAEWRPPRTRRWSERDGRAMVECLRQSGLSPSAFAREHGLDRQRVHYWIDRGGVPRGRRARTEPMVFAPVRVVGVTTATALAPAAPQSPLEVVVGQVIVRVGSDFDPAHLQRVVAALRGDAC